MVQLDLQSRVPIYEQLIGKLSELVLLGVLQPDAQLPTVRKLASSLGVNPNTVQKAYQELERRGIIYSLAGKGSFISSGDSAETALRQNRMAKLRISMEDVHRAGISKQAVQELTEQVYGGNGND